MPLDKLLDLARQYLQEFQQLCGKSVIKQPPNQTIWKPPDQSTLKTNFDGAMFEDLEAIGIESWFEIPLAKFWWLYPRSSLCHRLCRSVCVLGSAWEFIREWNGMECDGYKGMERNGMERNVFK